MSKRMHLAKEHRNHGESFVDIFIENENRSWLTLKSSLCVYQNKKKAHKEKPL